jgi:hypothetical protein
MPLTNLPLSVSRIHLSVSALTFAACPTSSAPFPALLLLATTAATEPAGPDLLAGCPAAGIAPNELVTVALLCAARIPELAMAAADGRGGSAAIPVGAVVEEGPPGVVGVEPPVLGLVAFPLGPTVAQTLAAPVLGPETAAGVGVCITITF